MFTDTAAAVLNPAFRRLVRTEQPVPVGEPAQFPITAPDQRTILLAETIYHCHILEHEDTEMMRPFVVTVTDMHDGAMGPMSG